MLREDDPVGLNVLVRTGSTELVGKVRYTPCATGDCWILDPPDPEYVRDYLRARCITTTVYVQTYEFIEEL